MLAVPAGANNYYADVKWTGAERLAIRFIRFRDFVAFYLRIRVARPRLIQRGFWILWQG